LVVFLQERGLYGSDSVEGSFHQRSFDGMCTPLAEAEKLRKFSGMRLSR